MLSWTHAQGFIHDENGIIDDQSSSKQVFFFFKFCDFYIKAEQKLTATSTAVLSIYFLSFLIHLP
jgi:hypothetical protein